MTARVLFVDHTGALGGAELVLLDIAEAYRETSTVVLLDDGPFRDRLVERGVTVQVLPGATALHAIRRATRWPSFSASIDAIRLALKLVPLARQHDCLYPNTQKAFPIACLAGMIARRPVIWDLNDLLGIEEYSAFHIKLDVLLTNHCATAVVANSRASAQALIQHGGESAKIHVLHNGIDATPFDSLDDADVAAARAEFVSPGTPLVGVFGRLAEWKGQHVALQAMRELPGVHLLIVGEALFGEQRYAERLRAEVAQLGLADRVHFAGFRRDIPRLMRAVDVVVHTSIAPEPFGRVIVEGMLAGRPVIATRAGGVEEIVESGVNGIMVTPGDARELASEIRGLLNDTHWSASLAQAGRKNAIEHFSVSAMVAGIRQHIDRLVPT
jgi:glycosyltransferase involved in cell wall biosynthesis